jgi:hypothetical protein
MTTESDCNELSLDSFPSEDSMTSDDSLGLESDVEDRRDKEIRKLRSDLTKTASMVNALVGVLKSKEDSCPGQIRAGITVRQSIIIETLLNTIQFEPRPDIDELRRLLTALAKT